MRIDFVKTLEASAPYIPGTIYFESSTSLIKVATANNQYRVYGGVRNAEYDSSNNILTITNGNGEEIEIDFSQFIDRTEYDDDSYVIATALSQLNDQLSQLEGFLENIDYAPEEYSSNLVRSGGVYEALSRCAALDPYSFYINNISGEGINGFVGRDGSTYALPNNGDGEQNAMLASLADVTYRVNNAQYVNDASYDSTNHRINFKHDSSVIAYIDATAFIKDGMVNDVSIHNGTGANASTTCLVVSFNTDAGKDNIELPLTSIFNPSNYYTKTQVDSSFALLTNIPTDASVATWGYIKSYTETDPIFSASAAAGITSSNITNWNNKTANGNAKIFYGTCTSNAAYITKSVTCSDFTSADLVKGALIFVTFDNTNTVDTEDVKLNVNNTGAKLIREPIAEDSNISYLRYESILQANCTYLFTYDGTYWILLTGDSDKNTTYSTITENEAKTGTATAARTVSPASLKRDIEYRMAQNQADWSVTDTTSPKYIANKPDIPTDASVSGWGYIKTIADASIAALGYTKNTGTLTGVKFNNTNATINGTVAEITATIPPEVTESTVSGWGFTKNTGTLTEHATHKLTATNNNATSTSGTITFVESLTGTNTATSGDLTITATRKSVTIPAAPGTLKTNNDTAQATSANEALSGTINLHKVAKTGTYSDLIGIPTIPTVNNATLTIQKNGTNVNTFTANASSNVTANIQVNELPTVTSSDNGKILQVVSGSWATVTPVSVYSGYSTPASSLGVNGDIYIQTDEQ